MPGTKQSGDKKTPTKILQQRGSWRAKEREKTEPQPEPGKPLCPPDLKGRAKREWTRLVKLLDAAGMLTKVDGQALARYCTQWVTYWEIVNDLSPDDDYRRLDKSLKLSDAMLRFETQYGMTPASRPNVKRLEKPAHGNAHGKDRFFQTG